MVTPLPRRRVHRLSGSAEVLDAIPYLMGFHPTESLVLVGLSRGEVAVTARVDLSDIGQLDLIDDTTAGLRRGGVQQFVLVVFDDRSTAPPGGFDDLPWSTAVSAVAQTAARSGIEVVEALLLCRGRWWSYLCDEPACCPRDGTPLADAPSVFAAAATVDGVVALPDRAALAATLDPLPEPERAALEPLLAAADNAAVAAALDDRLAEYEGTLVRELLLAARSSEAAGWPPPDDVTIARWAAALSATSVRDELWLAVDSRRLDGRPLWAELARRTPTPYDAAALFLLGWANWRAGNGALAGMAAERALTSDPSYSAADLLLAALAQAIDPRTFPRLAGRDPDRWLTARPRRARRAGAARTPR